MDGVKYNHRLRSTSNLGSTMRNNNIRLNNIFENLALLREYNKFSSDLLDINNFKCKEDYSKAKELIIKAKKSIKEF